MKHPLFDPLRGLAALWVVAFHLQAGSPAVQRVPIVSSLAAAGFLGVPMFFVISGFCLASAARRALDESRSASDFLGRRLWRIYPPFWCSVLLAAVLAPQAFAPDAGGWLRLLTLGQIFDPSQERVLDRFKELNSPYWSLAIEAQFYVVVALALWLRSRFFTVLAGVTAISLCAYASPAILTSGAFLPFWPPFALGVGLHEALRRGWTPKPLGATVRLLAVLALCCLLLVLTLRVGWAYGFHPSGRTGDLPNVVAFAVLFTALLWLACDWDFAAASPAWIARPVLLLGAMSYSVYLIHEPSRALMQSLLRPWLGGSPLPFGLSVLAGILILCWPFYLLCERPFLASRPRPTPRPDALPVPA